jgi:hypothetical protein
MSVKRVLVGAIAAIGGYLFILAIAALARFETPWLPYAAELAGALVAGGALARQGSGHRFESLAAGMLSVVIVAAVAFSSPHTYGWLAARSDHPWLTALCLLIACGVAGHAGARLAYGRGGVLSIVVLSTGVCTGALFFGTRLVTPLLALEIKNETILLLVPLYICSLLAGYAVQSVVPLANAGACSSGVAVIVGVIEIGFLLAGQIAVGWLWLVLAVVAAFVGALAAQALRRSSNR